MSQRTKLIALGTVLAALVVSVLLVIPEGEAGSRVPESLEPRAVEPLVSEAAPAVDVVGHGEPTDSEGVIREEVATAMTGSLLITVRWAEGRPAPGIMVAVRRNAPGMFDAVLASGISDASGEIRVEDLQAGNVRMTADRGGRAEAEIVAGRQQETEIILPAGIEVTGVVVNRRAQPVAGAAVWLQTVRSSWTAGRVLAHTGADGTFDLSGIPDGVSMGAFAIGYGPSELVDLDLVDTSAPPAVIRLVLEDDGGVLEGRVVNQMGAPVVDALIVAGEPPRGIYVRGPDQYIEFWTPSSAVSDEQGRFELIGVKPGVLPVAVRAEGLGLWRTEVQLLSGERAWLDVTLLETATVTGTVTDARGEPLSGARVLAYDRGPDSPFVVMGQIEFPLTFGYVGAFSDARGLYRLDGVTPGEVHLFAREEMNLRPGESVPRAMAVLEAEPGDELEWNPVITPGRTIEGVVLYEDGYPMELVFVTARDEGADQRHIASADREGRFRFGGLEGASYSLHVQYWRSPPGTPPLDRAGVVPGPGLVELRAPFPKPVEDAATSLVTGRIDDTGGRLSNPKAVQIMLSSGRRTRWTPWTEDGVFRFENLEAGRYLIGVQAGDTVVAQSDWFEVADGEVRDIGVLMTEPPGSVRIVLDRNDETRQLEPRVSLSMNGRGISHVQMGRRSEALLDNLTPGTYRVFGSGEGLWFAEGSVEVRAGEESEARIAIQRAVLRRFDVWFAEGLQPATVTARVVGRDGETSWEREFNNPARPLELHVRVPLGDWTVEVTTEGGLSLSTEFRVDSLDREYPVVRLDVGR